MIRVVLLVAVIASVVVVGPQLAAADEVKDTSIVLRHDVMETGEVDTAYFRYY